VISTSLQKESLDGASVSDEFAVERNDDTNWRWRAAAGLTRWAGGYGRNLSAYW